jgi:hypothetical protein
LASEAVDFFRVDEGDFGGWDGKDNDDSRFLVVVVLFFSPPLASGSLLPAMSSTSAMAVPRTNMPWLTGHEK